MRKAFIVLLLIIVLASVAAATTWQAKSETVMSGARNLLEREATNALGSTVSVGTIEIHGFSSVALTDISLRDKQGVLVATANRLTVAFNPLLLVTGSNPADAVHSITVEAPHLYLRQRADLSWNVEDFVKEQKTDGVKFGGNVYISRGWVSVATQNQGSYEADSVNGSLDFAVKPSIQVDLKGNHNNSWFTVEGSVNGKSRDALTVSIERLSLPLYQAAVPGKAVKITAGEANHVVLSLIREQEVFSYSGEAAIQKLTGEADGVAVENASALVCFDQEAVHVYNGDVRLWGQQVTLGGDVNYKATQPVFDLHIQAESFDSTVLPVATGVQGLADFAVNVKGTQSDFQATGNLSMAAGHYQAYSFTNAATQFAYQGNMVQLTGAEITLYGGRVAADGLIDIKNMTSDLRLSGRGLDGALLASQVGITNTGAKMDFDILLRGGTKLSTLNAAGSITLGSGQVGGTPFTNGYGGFHLQQGMLTVDYFNATVDSGMISAKGTWDTESDLLAVDLEGHNLPLQAMTIALPDAARATGTLQFTGTLSGKVADPRLTVALTAEHGEVLAQPFERLTGSAQISREFVKLQSVQLGNALTTHTIEGSIQLSGKKEINLTLASRNSRMETLMKPLPIGERITGNVDHDLSITGTIDNPSADGLLVLTDGSWRGYLLNSVRGSYRYRDGVAEIQNVVINSLDNQVIINGSVKATGELSLELIGNDIDLTRLPAPYPYPVSGTARVTASLTGSLAVPQMVAQAIIPKVIANGQVFDKVEANFTMTGSQIDCPSASFSQGPAAFSLNAGINLSSKQTYGTLRVEKAQASTIAALAKVDGHLVGGAVNGEFTWNGTLANPNATFSGSVIEGVVKGYSLGDVEMEASMTNRVIQLESLMIKQKTGLMAAKGQIDLNGDINIEAGARDIDATFFARIFDSAIDTQGTLSFTAQITGKTVSPHTAVSLEIASGRVANASFDKLFGLFTIEKGKIQINQLLLSKGEYKASAYGLIPLAALNTEGRKKASAADEMDLTLRLDHADLSILPILSKAITAASGETKGEVKVMGTLLQPKLSGQILVKEGTVKFSELKEPIQKVTVDIQFKDDTIHVRTFEGAVGDGKYRLTGSVAVQDMGFHKYNLSLELDKVSLTHKYFKGPVNGLLTLREEGNLPQLAGKLLLANTTVNIPVVPVPSSTSSALDIGLNVDLVIGEKVRLYNPMLYDVWVEGGVKLNGSLQEPDISGKIESLRGTLNYLRTQFRIDEANVAFTQFRSFEPVVSLKASTSLEQTDVILTVNGPATAMDVKLTSEPQMTQQEILSLLTLRSKFYERQASGSRDTGLGRDELVGMLDAGLQLQFFAEAEGMLRNSLGVDEFRLMRGASADPLFSRDRTETDQDQYRIQVGKYITERLMLNYTTGLSSGEKSYGARYDITKRISLTADVDEFNRLRVGVGMRFKF